MSGAQGRRVGDVDMDNAAQCWTAETRRVSPSRSVRCARQRWLSYVIDHDEGRVKSPSEPPVTSCTCAACAPAPGLCAPLAACRVTSESRRDARRRGWATLRESRRSALARRERARLPALPSQRACTTDEVREDHVRARIVAVQNAWQLAGYGRPPSEAMLAFAAESAAAEAGCRVACADADADADAGSLAQAARACHGGIETPPSPPRFRALTASSPQLSSPQLSTVQGLARALSWLLERQVMPDDAAAQGADGVDRAVRVAVRMAPMRTLSPLLPVRSPMQYGSRTAAHADEAAPGPGERRDRREATSFSSREPTLEGESINDDIQARLRALSTEMGSLAAIGGCSIVRRGSELWELLCHNAARGYAFVLDNGVDTFAVGPDAEGFPRVVHTTCLSCSACSTRRQPAAESQEPDTREQVPRPTLTCSTGGRHMRPPSPLCPEHVGSGAHQRTLLRDLCLRQPPTADRPLAHRNVAHLPLSTETCIGESMLWVIIRIPPPRGPASHAVDARARHRERIRPPPQV